MDKYRLCGGTLITENGEKSKDLLISDGKIEAIISREINSSESYFPIDCGGKYVSPGFVDIHQHGGGGSDYMDNDADAYLNATNAHLAHGTTSIMPTTLSSGTEATLRAVKSYKNAKKDSRIKCCLLGLHMEGRYISPEQAGAQKSEHISVYNKEEYRKIIEAAEGNIKRWSCAPEVDGAKEFAEYAQKNGIVLSIAHSNADFDTVIKAFDWGYRHITHLYSCTSSIVRKNGFRTAGVVEAAYYIDGMNIELIADGCHLPHSLLALAAKLKSNERIALVTDAMRAAGQEVETSFLGAKEDPLPVIIEDGVAKLTDRSAFGGSIATSDRLVRTMVNSGTSLCNAIKTVTVNPLEMMELKVKKGLLRPGYDADICVFDSNVNVSKVLCGGKLIIE